MIRLFALGGLSLERDEDGDRPRALPHTKRHALLAYLALAPTGGAHARDTLLALFWPESDERRARDALKQILRSLRRDLGDGAFESSGPNGVALSESAVWCDAVELREAAERGDHAAALELYRGELLPAMHLPDAPDFEAWTARRGAELRRLASTAGTRLATEQEERGDVESAIRTVRRVLELEPYDEASVRTLMRLHMAAGNNAAAVVAYEAYAWRAEEELDVGPTEETVALLEIARDRHPVATRGERVTSATPLDTRLGAGPPPALPSESRPLPPKVRPARRARWFAVGGAVMLVAAAITASQTTRGPASGDLPVRIVAFPFESVGPPDSAYFAAGLTDELRARLASIPDLAVVSAADRGSGLPAAAPDSLGRALDAAYVFLGSVRWLHDEGAPARVRVVPRLIDVLGNARGAGYTDRALIHGLMGDPARARMLYDSARVALEHGVANHPDDAGLRSLLGIAYAGAGRFVDGLREAERAVELLPVSQDAIEGATMLERLARVRLLRGEQDEGLALLDYLLSIPSEVSVPRLRIDPRFDGLRSNPAFERLLADAER